MRCVAKEWRKVCGLTVLAISAAEAYFFTAVKTLTRLKARTPPVKEDDCSPPPA